MEDGFQGRRVGPYQVERKLGEGGMGAVYLARHARLGREVALKVLPNPLVRENPEFVRRFFSEARAAAMLDHPNIVRVYDADEVEGIHFIAMEFVQGMDLKELLARRNPLSPLEAVEIVEQAARGLAAAADRKIIHRDIKPANLMMTESGVVKVADFGLAKNLDAAVQLTQSGQVVGTPAYMSPEQAEGKKADFHTDMYSLGVTLFECVVGNRPFSAETNLGLLRMHIDAPVPDPLQRKPDLLPSLARIIQRMLAKSPSDRFPTYKDLILALGGVKAELGGGGPGGSPLEESPLHTLSLLVGASLTARPAESVDMEAPTPAPGTRARAEDAAPTPATMKPAERKGGSRILVPLLAGVAFVAILACLAVVLATTGVFGRLLGDSSGADKARSRAEEEAKAWEEVAWVFDEKKPDNVVRAQLSRERGDALQGEKKIRDASEAFAKAGDLFRDETKVGKERILARVAETLSRADRLAETGDFEAALGSLDSLSKKTGIAEAQVANLRAKAEEIDRKREDALLGTLAKEVGELAKGRAYPEAVRRIDSFLGGAPFEGNRRRASEIRDSIRKMEEEEAKAAALLAECKGLRETGAFGQAIAKIDGFLPQAALEPVKTALSTMRVELRAAQATAEAEALLAEGSASEALDRLAGVLDAALDAGARARLLELKKRIEKDVAEEAAVTAADLVEPRTEAQRSMERAAAMEKEQGAESHLKAIREAWAVAEKAVAAKRLLQAARSYAACRQKAEELLALGPVIEKCREAETLAAEAREASEAFSAFAATEWGMAEGALLAAGKARVEGRFQEALRSLEIARKAFQLHQEAVLALPAEEWMAAAANLAKRDRADLGRLLARQRPEFLRRLFLEGAPGDVWTFFSALPDPRQVPEFLCALEPEARVAAILRFPAPQAAALAVSCGLRQGVFRAPEENSDRHGNPIALRNGSRVDASLGIPVELWLEAPRIELVLAPSGRFSMGSDGAEPGRYRDEGPQHAAAVESPFYLGKYEVTQDQWEAVAGGNPSANPGPRNPVDSVGWADARAFLEKLNVSLRETPAWPLEFRLPSEAEMEYAVRAGTRTRFVSGDDESGLDEVAWFRDNANGKSREAGRKTPNAFGLYDTLGNVMEWCADAWHENYREAPADGSAWIGEGPAGVLRGGSFATGALHCRSACRFRGVRDEPGADDCGLRLALGVSRG